MSRQALRVQRTSALPGTHEHLQLGRAGAAQSVQTAPQGAPDETRGAAPGTAARAQRPPRRRRRAAPPAVRRPRAAPPSQPAPRAPARAPALGPARCADSEARAGHCPGTPASAAALEPGGLALLPGSQLPNAVTAGAGACGAAAACAVSPGCRPAPPRGSQLSGGSRRGSGGGGGGTGRPAGAGGGCGRAIAREGDSTCESRHVMR